MGKGDGRRPNDPAAFEAGFERVFGTPQRAPCTECGCTGRVGTRCEYCGEGMCMERAPTVIVDPPKGWTSEVDRKPFCLRCQKNRVTYESDNHCDDCILEVSRDGGKVIDLMVALTESLKPCPTCKNAGTIWEQIAPGVRGIHEVPCPACGGGKRK